MKKVLIVLISIFTVHIYAQDIKGAYIRTTRISMYTYSISLTLFTDATQNVARPTVALNFGDGNIGTFSVNTSSTINSTDVKTYSGSHTFAGNGNYQIYCADAFRVSGIKNIQNSIAQQFYIETYININFLLVNTSSPTASILPLNIGVSGNEIVYNPNCTDTDNDSISYSLVNCVTSSSYYLPSNAIITATNGAFSFSKDSIGLYAFCIKITEWKKNSSNFYVDIGYSKIDFVVDITSTIGITEFVNKILNASFFPNPFNNQLSINTDTNELKKLIITNNLGQQVYTTQFYQNTTILDLPKIASGAYIVTLYLNNQINFRTKLIKQ